MGFGIKNKKIGIGRSVLNQVNIILGSGLLNMPAAIQEANIYLGLSILFIVCVICDYVSIQIVKMAKKKEVSEYENLAEKVFGKFMYFIIAISCFLNSFGAMVGYVHIVNFSNLTLLSLTIKNPVTLKWASIGTTLGLFLVLVLPFSYFHGLVSIALLSFFSIFAIGVICVILLVTGISIPDPVNNYRRLTGKGFFTAFGTLLFAFVCTDSVFPVYLGLENNTQQRWNIVVHATMGSLGSFYGLFAIFCYLTIPQLNNYVLNSASITNRREILAAKILLSLSLLLTYLALVYVTRTYIFSMFQRFRKPVSELEKKKQYLLRFVAATSTIVVSIFLGLLVDDLLFIVSFTGLLTSTLIGFIVPVLIIFKVNTFTKIWGDFVASFKGEFGVLAGVRNVANFTILILTFLFGISGLTIGVPVTILSYIGKL
ncbi:hypothetical protein MHBO_000309 [Bonamia ostreae]|uniref:Amino acid transporter transmembrane domain-containing protein n=1 Tax=Bonamia ostreae TaxID=126728 RepID=A0ABV2AFW0_9EUKA